ncbi:MAG: monovalent cation/H+ antiporter subunit D family protein [Candidatus Margulisbacteria bacterium]|nr:monovalent cation/H+ antiporter subunit D family protein [Candidatus Margulisiibacteriota bacterium]
MTNFTTILLTICIPIIGAFMIYLFGKKPNQREAASFATAFVLFGCVLKLFNPGKINGQTLQLIELFPGVSISFFYDHLSVVFAFVASSLWIVTTLYSIGYMRGTNERNQTRFYMCFALALSATMGVAFSANLLTLYIFYELLSISTYALVGHQQNADAQFGARKYLIYLFGGSIGLALPAMIIIYQITGTLDFNYSGIVPAYFNPTMLLALLLMFLYGFGKAGLMPFHAWLPGAMVAPTPVSSLLHAVAVVKVGVFSIIRVLTGIYGVDLMQSLKFNGVVCGIAAFTVITASLIALYQDNLKRLLAFSTIGQLAYIIMGVGLASSLGVTGGILHIVMHAFGKITLFFCAGAIYVTTKKKYISEMDGIGKQMPITLSAFFIGALSVTGLPPTGGFISKWMMLQGAMDANLTIIMIVYLVSSLLNACYFFPIIYKAFFKDPATESHGIKEAPLNCLIPPMITAACSILLFFNYRIFTTIIHGVTGGL